MSLFVDAFRLKQILLNFVLNSLKYTKYGFVKILVEQSDTLTKISVVDTGCAIKKESFAKIFQPPSTVNSGDIARHDSFGCNRVGGTVGFESSLKGSTFWVELPTDIPILMNM